MCATVSPRTGTGLAIAPLDVPIGQLVQATGWRDMSLPAENLDAALRALADGNRRAILALVRDGDRAVGEIAEAVGMSQQAVSHHLKVLRGAGLLTEQRQGTRHLFAVRTDGLAAVRDFLDGFWPTQLAALKQATERAARRGRNG